MKLKLTIAYFGQRYHGWQRQGGLLTVQGALEHAAARVFAQPVELVGASRTDAGVHAEGQVAHAAVIVPTVNPATVTPHTEAFQAVVWHLVVSHPRLLVNEMKWESVR